MNEFQVFERIGRGAYSKVKRVVREYTDNGQQFQDVYAMKVRHSIWFDGAQMMHKPTLIKERALRYDNTGTMEMINNLDKVYNEIELWGRINHSFFIKLYELIDADEHDYLYLILELANLG